MLPFRSIVTVALSTTLSWMAAPRAAGSAAAMEPPTLASVGTAAPVAGGPGAAAPASRLAAPTGSPSGLAAVNDQLIPGAVSDGLGGVLIAWVDRRTDGGDIYLKALDANGQERWPSVAVCVGAGSQFYPSVIPDGAHGAIVTWYDDRDYVTTGADLYAQHVRAGGTVDPAWPLNGTPVCVAAGNQTLHTTVSDGVGGMIAMWREGRNSGTTGDDIYVQRIRANGTPAWTNNGVAVCTASGDQSGPALAADGTGGAFMAWDDPRGGVEDIYVQSVDSTGVMRWTADGLLVCGATDTQLIPSLAADGTGGVFVVWDDNRDNATFGYDIYAAHVLGNGTIAPSWSPDGNAICHANGSQFYPTLVSDGSGGAIIAWYDGRAGNDDIYAQRVGSDGTVAWTTNGVALCTASGNQTYPLMVSDDAHGAIVAWRDDRVTGRDVYARRIGAGGALAWTADGVPVCGASGTQDDPVMVTDDAGGAIVAWQDARATPMLIYAARITGFAVTPWITDGVVAIELSLQSVEAEADAVRLAWYASRSGFSATVYRSEDGGSWQAIASIVPDGTGWLRYEDLTVDAGRRYGYRLGVITDGEEAYRGEAWVTTPRVAEFALEGLRPNPATGDLVVAYSLAGPGEATLELLDVSGRRIASRRLVAEAGGARVVDLGHDLHPAPGLYVIRLTLGGRTLTRKAVIAR
jgi:hypothetical protein